MVFANQELQIHEPSVQFLSPEHQQILNNADKIQAEFKKQPCHLERLYGLYTKSYLQCSRLTKP